MTVLDFLAEVVSVGIRLGSEKSLRDFCTECEVVLARSSRERPFRVEYRVDDIALLERIHLPLG